jgi:protein-S-isoprenylcysteine O-methyltransferase Ste14
MVLGLGSSGGGLALRRQLTAFPRPVPGGRLIEAGVFGLVRHPMYGGGVIVALGWGLARASPLTIAGALILAVFFDLKSRREEAWLAEHFQDRGLPGTRRLILDR